MLKPVEKQRVAEEIVEQLRSLILTGQYKPGSKLPPERELAKSLGVNRASLREALKKLEHLGLVRIRQGDGTRVQDFMQTGGIELVTHLLPLASSGAYPDIILDVLEFRRIWGREIARLATERATDQHVAELREIAQRAEADDISANDLFGLDFELYLALTRATGNRVMTLLVNTVRDAVEAHRPLLAHLMVDAPTVRQHHRELIGAVAAGDATRAATVANAYLQQGSDHIQRLMGTGQLKLPPTSA
jgi:GntR family transcriptional regulator, transcriptional repressor for pyruvate dehydrogenase complex